MIVIILMCAGLLVGCGVFSNSDDRVILPPDPDPHEYLYVDLARQTASEKACYLISPISVSVAPLNAPGTQAAYTRSQCFWTVTQRTARPDLCEHVVSVSTLLYSGHANNRERCIQEASRVTPSSGIGIIDHDVMFELAGFSIEDIDALMRKHRLPENGRYCLIFSREFFEAIEQMPRFSSDDDLEQMKKLEWKPHPFLAQAGFLCEGKFANGSE